MRHLSLALLIIILLQACSETKEYKHDGIYRASTPYRDILVIVTGNKLTFINPDNAEQKEYSCNQGSGIIEYQAPGEDVKRTLVVDPNNDLMLNNDVTLKRDK